MRRRVEQAFWDFHSRAYDDAASAGAFERELVEWIGAPAGNGGGVLVDLGCGTGRLLDSLAAVGWYVVGADVSPAMLRRARSRIPGTARSPVSLVRLDLNVPLPFHEVNQIVLVHSLQVVRDPGLVLQRVRQVLAPGGRVLVVVKKNAAHPRATGHFLIRALKRLAGTTGWTRSFPDDQLPELLDEAGFRVREDRSAGEVAAVMACRTGSPRALAGVEIRQ